MLVLVLVGMLMLLRLMLLLLRRRRRLMLLRLLVMLKVLMMMLMLLLLVLPPAHTDAYDAQRGPHAPAHDPCARRRQSMNPALVGEVVAGVGWTGGGGARCGRRRHRGHTSRSVLWLVLVARVAAPGAYAHGPCEGLARPPVQHLALHSAICHRLLARLLICNDTTPVNKRISLTHTAV